MVRNEGVLSLWRGLVLTLWRDVPFSAIYWGCVEYVRDELSKRPYFQRHPDSTFSKSFIAGSIGGAIAAIITTPFDVGKTRRQIDPVAASHNQRMIPYMFHIVQNEGFSALFVGAVPRILKVAPACAIMISSYEMGKKLFSEKNREAMKLAATTSLE
jgi:solute carrier family 25 protein 39/40